MKKRINEGKLKQIVKKHIIRMLKESEELSNWKGLYRQILSINAKKKELEERQAVLICCLKPNDSNFQNNLETIKQNSETLQNLEAQRIELLAQYSEAVNQNYGFQPGEAQGKIDNYNDYVRRNGENEIPADIYNSYNNAQSFLRDRDWLDSRM